MVLTCDLAENLKRVGTEEWKGSGTSKLSKEEDLKEIRESFELHLCGPEEELVMDATGLSPESVALEIVEWVRKVTKSVDAECDGNQT